MWALRIVHESSLYEYSRGSLFVTLTYRDPYECTLDELEKKLHVPDSRSLEKSHFTNFMKRFRHEFEQPIKFFQVGEYGNICVNHGLATNNQTALDNGLPRCNECNVGRPHHHAIIFNCSLEDREPVNDELDTSPTLEKAWKYGHVSIGEVNFQSAAYVARYCLKKITGLPAQDHYTVLDHEGHAQILEAEYCTMSRGGRNGRGIGYDWYQKWKDDLFPADHCPVPGERTVIPKVPDYYTALATEENPEMVEEVKLLRQMYRQTNQEEYTPERLHDKYQVKKAQVSLLKRTI